MALEYIDHYTLQVKTSDLPKLVAFYENALGLRDGRRPPFDFPGNWLYLEDKPVVHLVGSEKEAPLGAEPLSCGKLDHISFRCTDKKAMQQRLVSMGLTVHEQSVPGSAIEQLFVRDPAGLLVELTFLV